MGMDTHIVAFRPPDEKWNEMLAVYLACETAKVPIPDAVQKFFNYEDPQEKPGLEIDTAPASMTNGIRAKIKPRLRHR